jgi:hypothetical protein
MSLLSQAIECIAFTGSSDNALKTKYRDYANFVNLLQMPPHHAIQEP